MIPLLSSYLGVNSNSFGYIGGTWQPRCSPGLVHQGGGESLSREWPTGQRGWDQGASKRRSVIERIEGESPTDDMPSRESGLTSLWSFLTREPWPTDPGVRRRYVSRGNACWCGPQHGGGLAFHQLEEGLSHGSSAPGAYREGGPGGQMAQSQSSGLFAHPLVFWPGTGHSASHQ
jgi:hypothetical protein